MFEPGRIPIAETLDKSGIPRMKGARIIPARTIEVAEARIRRESGSQRLHQVSNDIFRILDAHRKA